MIFHVLGADIPHHNRTLLAFFHDQLWAELDPEQHRFYVVGSPTLAREFPNLTIETFASKRAVAKAVIAKSRQDSTAYWLFHGQYNAFLWLAILFGRLPLDRCAWHIWGADLYQTSRAWAFRLFYPLRRLAQKRLKTVLGTLGDLATFRQINAKAEGIPFYFPTKLPAVVPVKEAMATSPIRVLLGNSGDPSNQHLRGLAELHAQWGSAVEIVVPMGYPAHNQHYIAQVAQQANALFPSGQVEIWTTNLAFEAYLDKLQGCDLGYFPFERQQGIGTICLLTAMNIPVALSRGNPFAVDMQQQGVPFLWTDRVSVDAIQATQQALAARDKTAIRFFPNQYRQQWLTWLKTWGTK